MGEEKKMPADTVVSSLRSVTEEQVRAAATPEMVLNLLRTELGEGKVAEVDWDSRLVNSVPRTPLTPAVFLKLDFADDKDKVGAVGRMLHIVLGSQKWQTEPDRAVGVVSPVKYVGRDAFEYPVDTIKDFRKRLGSLTAGDIVRKNAASSSALISGVDSAPR
ncbi:hypothetical protein ACIQVR_30050 [Streptomyces xanthochromogenes]|uniref:hypothetical protein n=1 Tax=Streptomyces xanthochromogenes TaxID=67384 RepID=UPI00381B07B5